MLKQSIVALSSLLLASGALAAPMAKGPKTGPIRDNGFSYTYAQLGYDNWDYDNGPNVDTINGKLSYALDEQVFLRGGLTFINGDGPHHTNADGNRIQAGVGFHTPLQNRLDLVAAGDIISDHNDYKDETGFDLLAGVRHHTTNKLELSGGLRYENIYNDNLGVYGQALVHLNRQVDAGARISAGDNLQTVGLFGRYNF